MPTSSIGSYFSRIVKVRCVQSAAKHLRFRELQSTRVSVVR